MGFYWYIPVVFSYLFLELCFAIFVFSMSLGRATKLSFPFVFIFLYCRLGRATKLSFPNVPWSILFPRCPADGHPTDAGPQRAARPQRVASLPGLSMPCAPSLASSPPGPRVVVLSGVPPCVAAGLARAGHVWCNTKFYRTGTEAGRQAGRKKREILTQRCADLCVSVKLLCSKKQSNFRGWQENICKS